MEYLEALAQQGRDANPFFRLMEVEVGSYGNGTAALSMAVRPDMLNGVGWLQGGLYVALADEAMALALTTALKPGEGIATISENTGFLKGVNRGTITATARVVRKGRRVAFTESDVCAEDGTLLSRTSAAFAVVQE
ncbi:PaaI family thioesterase [Methanoculleus sp. FWC-SCC1]|uniref:PaaI family thioesterase n=1 Tax=Methanoculleus frigidifontis TaxID=2584085 RepID=A0ABT8MCH8_9EURY|nr:PaaI family thioesterase [Methanoculleus sp. FWC-SCC1]MDN7025580.1 PaaI family thioesterase [Methanoculleus sp. FWC-SCC1]